MISNKYRFHGRGALNYLFRNGRTERVEFMSIRCAASKRADYRLAVIVSKKVSKSAVVRNRIRRRIYEAVRILKKASDAPWNVDMSITVYDERLASVPSADLQDGVKRLLEKAKVL